MEVIDTQQLQYRAEHLGHDTALLQHSNTVVPHECNNNNKIITKMKIKIKINNYMIIIIMHSHQQCQWTWQACKSLFQTLPLGCTYLPDCSICRARPKANSPPSLPCDSSRAIPQQPSPPSALSDTCCVLYTSALPCDSLPSSPQMLSP